MGKQTLSPRRARIERRTTETSVTCLLQLDEPGECSVKTGVGFLDHMMTLFARHGRFGLELTADGDLEIDDHHTVEDVGIVLGRAFRDALGDKKQIGRYGHAYVPMDEALCRAVVDLSGRFYLQFDAAFARDRVGDLSTEMVRHFWYSFAEQAACNLHLSLLAGENDHHKVEAMFKAAARALRMAVERDKANDEIPSTKGTL